MARSHDIRQKWHRVQNERFLPQKENSTKSFRLYPSPFCFLTAPPFLRKCRSSTDKTSAFNLHFRLLNENRLQLIHDQAFKNLKKLEILYVYRYNRYNKGVTQGTNDTGNTTSFFSYEFIFFTSKGTYSTWGRARL